MNPLIQHEQTLIKAGHQSLWGSFAQQNPGILVSFNRLLNAHNFDTIIELGTHDGGLSTLFALYCYLSRYKAQCVVGEPVAYKNQTHHRKPKSFVTYDIVRRDATAIAAIHHLEGRFVQADTLDDILTIDDIRSSIEDPASGTVLLLCDGGNKKRELELYGGSLKPGDFVCLHDWAYDRAAAAENARQGIWHAHETMWEDQADPEYETFQYPLIGRYRYGIKDLCERYGIEPIYRDEFDKVAWFVGVKR